MVVLLVQHTLDMAEHSPVDLGAELERINPAGQFGLDFVHGFAVRFGQRVIVGAGYTLLELVQGERSAFDQHIGSFNSQKTRLQQRLEVVAVHLQQEKAGQFRGGSDLPHNLPGYLQLLTDDIVNFFRSNLLGCQGSAIACLQKQRQGFLDGTCLEDTPQLGRVQHLRGELADTAYRVFVTCLRHAISPPRQRACPPLPFQSGCGHPSV